MSSGPENRFIQSLHRLLPPRVYRMKNHNPYNSGIPDCWYSGDAGDLWVEYKFMQLPKRASSVVDLTAGKTPLLSSLQQQWLRTRHNEGRAVGVIIGTLQGGLWLPGIAWEKPLSSAECSAAMLGKSALASLLADYVCRQNPHDLT